jgi:hypothetical protein
VFIAAWRIKTIGGSREFGRESTIKYVQSWSWANRRIAFNQYQLEFCGCKIQNNARQSILTLCVKIDNSEACG